MSEKGAKSRGRGSDNSETVTTKCQMLEVDKKCELEFRTVGWDFKKIRSFKR